MTIFTRRTKADRHKAAGDRYLAQGGNPAVRAEVDLQADLTEHQQRADASARAELGRAELRRGRG